jgi:FdhD protein
LPARLEHRQPLFARTGGVHAAGLWSPLGDIVDVAEDVGRHNAADKVLGAAARRGAWPLGDHVLIVSGRVSFEIVQKAAMAGLGAVVAVSAPTSMAVEEARALGLTLVGFVRGGAGNLYAGAWT